MRSYVRTFELGELGSARIVGWGVMGLNTRTHDVEMAQYEPDEAWRASEHAARLDSATMAPII